MKGAVVDVCSAALAALISPIPQIFEVVIIGVNSIVKFRRYPTGSDRREGRANAGTERVDLLQKQIRCPIRSQRLVFDESLGTLSSSGISSPHPARSASFGSQFKISLGVQLKLDVSLVGRSGTRSVHPQGARCHPSRCQLAAPKTNSSESNLTGLRPSPRSPFPISGKYPPFCSHIRKEKEWEIPSSVLPPLIVIANALLKYSISLLLQFGGG